MSDSAQPCLTKVSIEGMHCAACVRRVTRALEKVEGVEAASVNFATRTAWISHSDGLNADAFIQAVDKAGFQGSLPQKGAGSLPSEAAKREADSKLRTFIWSAALTLPVFAISMIWHHRAEWVNWLLLALTTPVVFAAGWEFISGAWSALKQKTATMDTLVALGTLAAYGVSVYGLMAHRGHQQSEHIYLESAAVIVTLILLGRTLEARARGRMTKSIEALTQLSPERAVRLTAEKGWKEVPIQLVLPGDSLMVRPGDKVPADGRVLAGRGEIDASLMTGEPLPVLVEPGSPLQAGTLNLNSVLIMEAQSVGDETALARIIQMVEEAQGSKAPMQSLADKVSSIFVPIVILLAVAAFGLAAGAGQGWEAGAIRLATVLVVACPCALGLATPTALVVGVGKGAEFGLLVRNGEALERAASVKTLLLDKTGTITKGKPELIQVLLLHESWSEDQALALAAGLAEGSSHPLAASVVQAAKRRSIVPERAQDQVSHPGQGILGFHKGQKVALGRPDWASQVAPEPPPLAGALSLLTLDGSPLAWLNWQDEMAEGSAEAVAALLSEGIRPILATGDRQSSAEPIARQAGISTVRAGMSPQDKASLVAELKSNGPVGMVGDGINDAPALALADVGVAMGGGADAAKQAGDIVLLRQDLRLLPKAVRLAKRTLFTIKTNLAWAFGYNVLMIPLAMSGVMNPMIASGAMALSSVSVVLNALSLRRFRG